MAALTLASPGAEWAACFRSAVTDIASLSGDDHGSARKHAAFALAVVATEYPDSVASTVDTLAGVLDAAGQKAADALGAVADGGNTARARRAVERYAPGRVDGIIGK